MQEQPQKEHQWLQQLVGNWTSSGSTSGNEQDDVHAYEGTEVVRSIGDLWIQAEGLGEMPDGTNGMRMMSLGFDPKKDRFVGTWIGSMMTHLWIYEGQLENDGRRLSLDTVGPSMSEEGGMAEYKDVIDLVDDNHRTLTAFIRNAQGEWTEIMRSDYYRQD